MGKIDEISERSRKLVDVCLGRESADIVIRNGKWACVQSGEIVDNSDVAIKDERIAYVGEDAQHTMGGATRVIDAKDQYLVPGLLDGHTHVESSMVSITEMVRSIIIHGTTGIFVDPHEIANVFGINGIKAMVEEALIQPIHVWLQIASCVPSFPGLEESGAEIDDIDVKNSISWPQVIGLGEVMNYESVIENDKKLHDEMAIARVAGKVIGGHYASPDLSIPFHAYVAAGPEDDHEGICTNDAIARVRQGMKVMMRYSPGLQDVAKQIRAITEHGIDSRHFMLVSDGSQCLDLVNDGHMDIAYKHAIEHGISPMAALQMLTINTATHFGLTKDVGMIAPGRYADILVVSDMNSLNIELVIAKGKIAVKGKEITEDVPTFNYPKEMFSSVHIKKPVTREDFELSIDGQHTQVGVNVIGVIKNQAPTKHIQRTLNVSNGKVLIDTSQDVIKAAVVERHTGNGVIKLGFVHGFGFKEECAFASTIAHDAHHLVVIGTEEDNMAVAVNRLSGMGGGQIVVREGVPIAEVYLPIGGLMSNKRVQYVAKKIEGLRKALVKCGSKINATRMITLLSLVTIPELRITTKGLVDVTNKTTIPVIYKKI